MLHSVSAFAEHVYATDTALLSAHALAAASILARLDKQHLLPRWSFTAGVAVSLQETAVLLSVYGVAQCGRQTYQPLRHRFGQSISKPFYAADSPRLPQPGSPILRWKERVARKRIMGPKRTGKLLIRLLIALFNSLPLLLFVTLAFGVASFVVLQQAGYDLNG